MQISRQTLKPLENELAEIASGMEKHTNKITVLSNISNR